MRPRLSLAFGGGGWRTCDVGEVVRVDRLCLSTYIESSLQAIINIKGVSRSYRPVLAGSPRHATRAGLAWHWLPRARSAHGPPPPRRPRTLGTRHILQVSCIIIVLFWVYPNQVLKRY
jgi:hypothetical protein